MGHIASKQAYDALRKQVDKHPIGAPDTQAVYEILQLIYTPDEAALGAQLPLKWSTLGCLSRRLKIPEVVLQPQLESLADKGLVMDLFLGGKTRYMLMPTVVGFFEFSMMRTRDNMNQKELAKLFHRVMVEEPEFVAQFAKHASTTPFRTLVHEGTLPETYTEVLDWERATHLVQTAGKWAAGLCHCRHVAHHLGRECEKFPMEHSCLSLGKATEYMTHRGLARAIDRQEALDLLTRSKEQGMVHLGDNVQQKPVFICNCCGCCCEVLGSYKKFDVFANQFSSNFEAVASTAKCTGCKKCQTACPVDAIDMVPSERMVGKKKVKRLAVIDREVCIGCGVCVPECKFGSMQMVSRPQRQLTPVDTMARVLTQALEQGKLHTLLIDTHSGFSAQAASALMGALLKLPPAKQLLANDAIKSRFVTTFLAAGKLLTPKPKQKP